jgi:hypothetical protein
MLAQCGIARHATIVMVATAVCVRASARQVAFVYCCADSPLCTTRSAAAAGLLQHDRKGPCSRGALRRVEPLCTVDLSLERWALVVHGAHVSSLGRCRTPDAESRTVRIEGRCASR